MNLHIPKRNHQKVFGIFWEMIERTKIYIVPFLCQKGNENSHMFLKGGTKKIEILRSK